MFTLLKKFTAPVCSSDFKVLKTAVLLITDSTPESGIWRMPFDMAFQDRPEPPVLESVSVCEMTRLEKTGATFKPDVRPCLIMASIDAGYTSLHHACEIAKKDGIPIIALATKLHPLQMDHLRRWGVNGLVCLEHITKVFDPQTLHMVDDPNWLDDLCALMQGLVDDCAPVHFQIETLYARDQIILPANTNRVEEPATFPEAA